MKSSSHRTQSYLECILCTFQCSPGTPIVTAGPDQTVTMPNMSLSTMSNNEELLVVEGLDFIVDRVCRVLMIRLVPSTMGMGCDDLQSI